MTLKQRISWLLGSLMLLLAVNAYGHSLSVFAWVEGDTLMVETRFSSGKIPVSGTITLYDGYDQKLSEHPITGEEFERLPLPNWESGLKVVSSTGDGHDNYWILTPEDIRQQRDQETQ